ncbi:MAG: type II toxin-antitoxin system Phd/YefM family antitoxin [Anaerolineaceae bacterium]|jgi:prevent-host-death family protein|nr:MAG: type II toxin-antitoxin system Phd/YefM family antitoxin [Anaerolineaceae bacterium]
MPVKYLPATEVKNRFGRVLREVAKSGGPIYVERDGKSVAVILSVREYERTKRVRLSPAKAAMVRNVFGMWMERADITEDWVGECRARWESDWKNG